jgi:hypothetical protein
MPFFGLEPFDSAEATYVWTGKGIPGFFIVTVKGHAPKFSFGFKLEFETVPGGLFVDVDGWTGPLTKGTDPYTVSGQYNGFYLPEIVVRGSNKTEIVHVKEIPFTSDDEYVRYLSSS